MTMGALPGWPRPVARFARLGPPLVEPVALAPLPAARRLWGEDRLAAELGLDATAWRSERMTQVLAGNAPWPGAEPTASAYAGHQFGRLTARLGDGRAALIAELHGAELQLKGAGPTPFARGADGRAVLRSSIREVLASEALHALGVPTTRALALVASPLEVQRDGPETAAVVCRVAPSFLRFGHFEYLRHHGLEDSLQRLAGWVMAQHFPHCANATEWLADVARRSAHLVAAWQTLGFCHGVLNTDNCSLLGLTLDYGPYGFLERYRPHHVCNASDTEGRYAYAAQPAVMRWNVERLLDACTPLGADRGAVLAAFDEALAATLMQRWAAKLGLARPLPGDESLVLRWLALLQRCRADFTLAFRALGEDDAPALRQRFAADAAAFDAWHADWQTRLALQGEPAAAWRARMRGVNPLYVLRNHLAQAAIEAAQEGDTRPLHRLHAVLARPFDRQPGCDDLATPPAAHAPPVEVSCSA